MSSRASETFSKMLCSTNFWFKHFLGLCLAFWGKGFDDFTQKFEKKVTLFYKFLSKVVETVECYFRIFRTFIFDLKVAPKPFCKLFFMRIFLFDQFWRFWLTFWENGFNFGRQKSSRKWIVPFWNTPKKFFLFSQKLFSTWSMKIKKGYFRIFRTFLFDHKVAAKLFSEMLFVTFFLNSSQGVAFKTFKTFVFELPVASKPIFKMLYLIHFW